MQKHAALLDGINDESERLRKLCELNVIEQVANVCQTTIVQEAWERGHELTVHGWIYGLENGLLRDLNMLIASQDEVLLSYRRAIEDSKK